MCSSLLLCFVFTADGYTLRELIDTLESVYCSTIGYEYMHMRSREECNWLRERIEHEQAAFSKDEKYQILDRLNYADTFEYFLSQKYVTPSNTHANRVD